MRPFFPLKVVRRTARGRLRYGLRIPSIIGAAARGRTTGSPGRIKCHNARHGFRGMGAFEHARETGRAPVPGYLSSPPGPDASCQFPSERCQSVSEAGHVRPAARATFGESVGHQLVERRVGDGHSDEGLETIQGNGKSPDRALLCRTQKLVRVDHASIRRLRKAALIPTDHAVNRKAPWGPSCRERLCADGRFSGPWEASRGRRARLQADWKAGHPRHANGRPPGLWRGRAQCLRWLGCASLRL